MLAGISDSMWAAIIGGGLTMGAGLLTVAVKLGGLTRAVDDFDKRLGRLEDRILGPRRR